MAGLRREDHGRIVRLVLDDPDRLNPLSAAMLAELSAALDALAQDRRVKVVILAAAGRAFCAGHDLREIQAARAAPDGGAAAFADLFDACSRVMLALRALPQPVIAEVQGLAAAAGCQLVASCDMAVAAPAARFGVNGVNIGLFCSTPMVALTRAIPPKAAFEMLTTGRFIDTAEARALGLINRISAEGALPAETMELAETLAAKLGPALRIGKGLFHDQAEVPLAQAYAMAGAAMVRNLMIEETAEGIDAFLHKRPPDWPADA